MTELFYAYVESKTSAAFQFVAFTTREQAELFAMKVSKIPNLRATVIAKI